MSQSSDFSKGFVAGSRAQLAAMRARFSRAPLPMVALPQVNSIDPRQRRYLPWAVIIALLAGFLLIKSFLTVILLSLLAAVLFHPVYAWLLRKTKRSGLAASLTFGVTLLAVIIPLTITILITYGEVHKLVNELSVASTNFSLSDTSEQLLNRINSILGSLTHGTLQINLTQLQDAIAKMASELATFFLNILSSSFSGIAGLVTQFLLYMYVFMAILTNTEALKKTFSSLNPLGGNISNVYLDRAAKMTKGVVGGQFLIAFSQGIAEAAVLYIAGLHYFFFFALILSFLSIIPLGGGIIAIPIGIIMVLSGNVWGGLFVLAMHFCVIVNIDNVLRPRLIPKAIRMNSALMLLAVFGGLGIFGFLGIAIGPIIMILVLTTLQIYAPLAETQQRRANN